MKPPFSYFGGKTVLAERIAGLFPDHGHYVEPYCGALSVLLAKAPSKLETVNDLDGEVVTFWRILRDRPADLLRAMRLTPHSQLEYRTCMQAEPTGDPLETARRVWVRLAQGRGGQLRRTTGWRYFSDPAGTNLGMPGYLDAYVERAEEAAARLATVSLECRPALDVIADYGKHPGTLLYVDPPYVGTTRAYGNQYRHEMRTDDEHRELAAALRAARATVVLSGYPSDLYDLELYADWYRVGITTRTNQGGPDGHRIEVLWSNRPIGAMASLFDDLTEEGTAA